MVMLIFRVFEGSLSVVYWTSISEAVRLLKEKKFDVWFDGLNETTRITKTDFYGTNF